ncbi:AbrB/MazE/SpoVT family DNA-binding domain-containing protein [Asticcacaulis excentricus]|uniref:Transcriptional regulator AbrB n=1 Tax=Asticcacaulis excentricus TaxID=78587 RepID=A0A3G9G5L6_9CAUL|nr:AbrB/MazE/SpoVT family DNA-binding domain-containing protein [Asticcacaulis excentricus]BBF79499.1 transcriptional regulator AbrB [Asticcacaulis excentricus]
MKASLRKMGNSQGVIIPKAVIAQLELSDSVEMTVTDTAIILEKPKTARAGWGEASRALAEAADDGLVWPDVANADDADLTW